jgi:hypothetical protein
MAGVRLQESMMITLVPLLVLIGIAVWVVKVSRRGGGEQAISGRGLRRFLQYAFLLAALFTGAAGTSRLIATLLPTGAMVVGRTEDLALGLSMTVVALPVWALLWRAVYRQLRADPAEREAPAWALYLVVATTVSLVLGYLGLVGVGRWLTGLDPYDPFALASVPVWSAVWVAHTWWLRPPALRPISELSTLSIVAGAATGLVAMAVGAANVLRYLFGEAYHLLAGPSLVEADATEVLRHGLVVGALAAVVWWWHWLRQGVAAPRRSPWFGYRLVAMVGGLVTAMISGGLLLHTVLQWLIGVPEAARPAVHFQPVSEMLAAAIVGVWIWTHHRTMRDGGALQPRSEPVRAHDYVVTGVGLVTWSAGVTVAIMAALQAAAPGGLASADPRGQNAFVVAVTLLLVGLPVWWTYWHQAQGQAHRAEDHAELRSPTRRVYLLTMTGLAGLTSVTSLSVLLFVVFRDLLEGTIGSAVIHELRAAVGLVLTAGAVAGYHGTMYRADRLAQPLERPAGPRNVLLVSSDGRQLASAVAEGTGAKVRSIHRLDIAPGDIEVQRVNAAILASPHERVLVTVDEGGMVDVIPYEDA